VVNATSWPFFPGEGPGTHCIGGWLGPRAGLDGCVKFPTPGFDPRTVQLITSRYSYCATSLHNSLVLRYIKCVACVYKAPARNILLSGELRSVLLNQHDFRKVRILSCEILYSRRNLTRNVTYQQIVVTLLKIKFHKTKLNRIKIVVAF
jgi:hypothetical protein